VERGDLSVELADDFVATVEIRRPPDNYIDVPVVAALADAYEKLERDSACRAIVLCSEGRHFSAGVAFGPAPRAADELQSGDFYREAVRLFDAEIPVVAAVQGAAVEARDFERKISRERNAHALERLKKTMRITELVETEQAKMREAVKPVIDKYTKIAGESLVAELKTELARIRTRK